MAEEMNWLDMTRHFNDKLLKMTDIWVWQSKDDGNLFIKIYYILNSNMPWIYSSSCTKFSIIQSYLMIFTAPQAAAISSETPARMHTRVKIVIYYDHVRIMHETEWLK